MGLSIEKEALERMTAQVFQEAAFVFTEPAETEPMPEDPAVWSVLTLEGPQTLRLGLAVAEDLGTTLVANLLALESDDPTCNQRAGEATAEMLNILAGYVAEGAWGSHAQARYGLPEVRGATWRKVPIKAAGLHAFLQTEEGQWIGVWVELFE